MIHRFLLLTLVLFVSTSACAEDDYSWCQGYVVKALGEFPVKGVSRLELWLHWNEIVAETIVNNSLDQERYQAGRDHFSRLRDEGNVQGLMETSEEDCAVGRNSAWAW